MIYVGSHRPEVYTVEKGSSCFVTHRRQMKDNTLGELALYQS